MLLFFLLLPCVCFSHAPESAAETLTLAKSEVLLLSMSAHNTENSELSGANTYPGILFIPTRLYFP